MEQREQAHKGTLEERRGGAEGGLAGQASRKLPKPDAMWIPQTGPEPASEPQLALFQDRVNLDKASRVS